MTRHLLHILLCLLLSHSIFASDTDSLSKTKEVKFTFHIIGIDVSKILLAPFVKSNRSLEFSYTSNLKQNLWFTTETGIGNSFVDNDFLNYKTQNFFMRVGVDKILFNPEFIGDYSNALIGVRYANSWVQRGEATYIITDSIWRSTSGNIGSNNFIAHWAELVAGFRVEWKKRFFIGTQIRFKTFLNPSRFELLQPNYLAGFGRADRGSAFSYNVFLSYGFGSRK